MSVRDEREGKKRSDTYRAEKKNSDQHGDLRSMMQRSVARENTPIVLKKDNTPFNNREL
ncbi:hypothetical protein BTHE68_31540 [Burkholderia sp. THE68]|uniref:hypothetical protein n=1 Tax=Burkholderia sp. THE68 TaxID=758782 RepID=UPI001317052D|nr:hypothetical protein [Burkholderia sp. THE68]BBU29420.1 hypothetical protein BTHE68_31540 [Burkholderia sp. THE68]